MYMTVQTGLRILVGLSGSDLREKLDTDPTSKKNPIRFFSICQIRIHVKPIRIRNPVCTVMYSCKTFCFCFLK